MGYRKFTLIGLFYLLFIYFFFFFFLSFFFCAMQKLDRFYFKNKNKPLVSVLTKPCVGFFLFCVGGCVCVCSYFCIICLNIIIFFMLLYIERHSIKYLLLFIWLIFLIGFCTFYLIVFIMFLKNHSMIDTLNL